MDALVVAAEGTIEARGDGDWTRGLVQTEERLVLVATDEELLAGLAQNAAERPVGLSRIAANLTRSRFVGAAHFIVVRTCVVAVFVVVGDAVFYLAHLTVENGHVLHWCDREK